MGVAERRLREKEQRRTSIINAAEKVFFAKGVDSATMDEVAETAELSKGLLYFYFKNKDDLCHAIVHRGLSILGTLFREALQAHDRGIDQVMAIGQAYVRFGREYQDYFRMMSWFENQHVDHSDPDTFSNACEEEGDQDIELVALAVKNGLEDGTIRSDLDPLETAIILWAQTHGLVQILQYKEVKLRHRVDTDALLRKTFEFIKEGLLPR